eukprot:CFRG0222T1
MNSPDTVNTDYMSSVIQNSINNDPNACDMRLCLFGSALHSTKCASVCKPPIMRAELWDGRKSDRDYYDHLKELFAKIPPVEFFLAGGIKQASIPPNPLLESMMSTNNFSLQSVPPRQTFQCVQRLTGSTKYRGKPPDLVFEVHYHKNTSRKYDTSNLCTLAVSDVASSTTPNGISKTPPSPTTTEVPGTRGHHKQSTARSRVNDGFESMKERYGYSTAYHGSAVENFFSILNSGFLGHMNTTSLYGEGTYLSSDLAVASSFAPSTGVWNQSMLASRMTCVCACEVINHPDVKRGFQKQSGISLKSTETIPDKYFVVPSNEHVRVRYLFVWTVPKVDASQNFLRRHKVWVALVLYAVLLAGVGLCRSPLINRWVKKY